MESTDKKGKIQAVSRAVDILRCFGDARELGLTEISKQTGLHKSTTAGLVSTLCTEGLMEQNKENGKYRLGLELFRLGKSVNTDVHDICHPFLLELSEMVGETVNLAMLDGDSIVYIDKIDSPHSMRICSRIGQRLPFYCTATGKSLVAELPEDRQEEIILNFDPFPYTENTLRTSSQVRKTLAKAHADGYACDNEEYEIGLICYSMPIKNADGPSTLAVSVSSPIGRMTDEYRSHILNSLKIISSKIADVI